MEYNLIGKTLGDRYEILEIVGSGGMATVYKARCRLLNRFVVVKVLKESLKNDPEMEQRFKTEARAAASLSHHNIVSVYDVGETDSGLSYIVMEFVDGITLKEYIEERRFLSWREACEFAVQIAIALECAHRHGIVHRDIKPHNIILTKEHTLKVADFGIARTTSSETVVASGKSNVFGSVNYISPEQARGGYVDARSDIYSLGVVLYEMLTGKLPFRGDNPVSVALMKIENEPEDIREAADFIPDAVADIVMKAIAKEQYARYQSAEELAIDLREVLDSGKISRIDKKEEEDEDMPSNKRRKSKQNKNLKLVVFSIVLAIIMGVGVYSFFYGGKKEYLVPNLIDKTLEEAIEIAQEADFKIDEDKITYEASDEYEEGKIMKQTPGAENYVKKNKPIEVVISSGLGDGNIEVPQVIGYDYAKAASMLRAAKLKYRKIEEDSSEYALNEVINQSPKAGQKVTEGYVVILRVSTGNAASPSPTESAKMVPVPKLVGNMYENAENTLKTANLKLGNVSREESDKPEGVIISQSPKQGSESPEGSYVNIVVSSGQAAKETPTHTPTQEPLSKKTLTIQLPQTDSGTVHVKIVANGSTIYDKQHQCSEGEVDVTVAGRTEAKVEVYFDGVLQTTKIVDF